jgi:hypothetical protein
MNKRLHRRLAWGLLLFGAGVSTPAFAANPVIVPTAQAVEWSGNHKVLYEPGYDITWVFFENSTGFSYEAYNGVSWINGGVAISTTEANTGNPVNLMYGAIYYVQATSNVYVVANDPSAPTGNENSFLKGGHLNSDGSISWGPLTTRTLNGTIGGGTGGCYGGYNVDVTLVASEVTGGLVKLILRPAQVPP